MSKFMLINPTTIEEFTSSNVENVECPICHCTTIKSYDSISIGNGSAETYEFECNHGHVIDMDYGDESCEVKKVFTPNLTRIVRVLVDRFIRNGADWVTETFSIPVAQVKPSDEIWGVEVKV